MYKLLIRIACAASALALLGVPAVHATGTKAKPRVAVKYPARAGAKPRVAIHARGKKPAEAEIIAGEPNLKSSAALVFDLTEEQTIYGKNTQNRTPIASITKLMTSMVVLDANLPLEETIYIEIGRAHV